ncbi:MAG: type restriction-modification system methyltransferase subunit [Verrucomicrobiales bacterium]|nr:type restriction-modification system methyltransferase subunit [Verrucomicrobiales bacterium]
MIDPKRKSKNGDVTWNHDPHSQIFLSFAQCEQDTRVHSYLHQLRRAFKDEDEDGLGVDVVLCVDNRPTVYFQIKSQTDVTEEIEWQRKVWNQGLVTLAVIESSQDVRVYSALAKPSRNTIGHDDNRLIETLSGAALALEQIQFVRSVETGQFYRRHQKKFTASRSIDQYLLKNLSAAREQLCDKSQEHHLSADTAHSLLGRTLFTGYLLERGIIGERHLKSAGAPKGRTLRRVLSQVSDNTECRDILYRLFRQLQDDFNGSLFGGELPGEQGRIRAWHVGILKRFLSGDDFEDQSQQPLSLNYDFYDFRFIPIELISGIYEHFLAAAKGRTEEAETEDGEAEDEGQGAQREAGAYYTPPRLAELVVDIATEKMPSLLGKRFLDPSCGSGIFLVILFHRMAEEWRRIHSQKRNENDDAYNLRRTLALRDSLSTSFCGVDRDGTACMVACFSLYLAFLDQLEPRNIWNLQRTLGKKGTEKVLPPLMDRPDEGQPVSHPPILKADFFKVTPAQLGEFDLIVGNPPWIGRNQSGKQVAEQWLIAMGKNAQNPYLAEWLASVSKNRPKKAVRKARFFPQDQSAVGFMWKSPVHSKETGRICLLLPSRVLMNNNMDAFQTAWFKRFQVGGIWQLADYRRILFSGAKCPAVIIQYQKSPPTEENPKLRYLTPKAERLDPRTGCLFILPDDVKTVETNELVRAAKQGRTFTVWKKHFWGTDRDIRLVDRLLNMPLLGLIAGEVRDKKRWFKGQGFQPKNKDTKKPTPIFWKKTDRFLDARNNRPDLILLRDDTVAIRDRFKSGLHRSREAEIYSPPLVLVNQGCTRFVFSDFPVLFQDSLQSFSTSKKDVDDEDLLLFLTAVLNSPLSAYFFFHVSANLGIERDKVHLEELLLLPFPLPDDTDDPKASWQMVRTAAGRLRSLQSQLNGFALDAQREAFCVAAKNDLNEIVYRYYDVARWERDLIDDTIRIFKPSIMPFPSRLIDLPTLVETSEVERKIYAEHLRVTLNRWANRQGWKLSATGHLAAREGLCLVTLTRDDGQTKYSEKSSGDFDKLLRRLADAAQVNQSGITYLRGFYLIEGNKIHILKPLAQRHWTKTAALNDADELWGQLLALAEH